MNRIKRAGESEGSTGVRSPRAILLVLLAGCGRIVVPGP